MKILAAILGALALGVAGCSKHYDYSGTYEATIGDGCEVEEGDNTFVTISPAMEEGSTYVARLSSHLSGFPLESRPSRVSDDGTITFSFFKEGRSGFFSGEPSVDMRIKAVPKNSKHIYFESWSVVIGQGGSFDFVRDAEIAMWGDRPRRNEMASFTGDNGLCLKKLSR